MKPKGKEVFESYYKKLFDTPTEFSDFLESLKNKPKPILRIVAKNHDQLKKMWTDSGLEWRELTWYKEALVWPANVAMGEELPGYSQRLIFPMSASSLIPVLAMQLKATDKVLDACAAPGGKALMINSFLDQSMQLTVNELSFQRAMRMKKLMAEYGVDQSNLIIGPAEKLWRRVTEGFDKILIDAPCSSEAHVYRSKEHLKIWSHNRIDKLSHRQEKMIASLIPLLNAGGKLVYSTCAVTPEENEVVIQKILHRFGDEISLVDINWQDFPGGEGMKYPGVDFDLTKVRRIWSHKENLEPMFVAVLEKKLI